MIIMFASDARADTVAKPAAAVGSRVRTVLSEYQLHVLRTCYAVSARPDAATRDRLTEMTGLGSRVVRIWFQNKRCKDKKRSAKSRLHSTQRDTTLHDSSWTSA